jgi:hypothetical protein
VRAVVLNPPSYSCPDDHSDLTGLVTQALSGDGLAVARFAVARGGTEQCRSSLGRGSAPPTLTCGALSSPTDFSWPAPASRA